MYHSLNSYLKESRYHHLHDVHEKKHKHGYASEAKDLFDVLLFLFFRYPLLIFSIGLAPIVLFMKPLNAVLLSFFWIMTIVLVYLNALILYVVGITIKLKHNRFSRMVWFAIPMSVIIPFVNIYQMAVPMGGFVMFFAFMVLFALDFKIEVYKGIFLGVAMYFIDFIVILTLAFGVGWIAVLLGYLKLA